LKIIFPILIAAQPSRIGYGPLLLSSLLHLAFSGSEGVQHPQRGPAFFLTVSLKIHVLLLVLSFVLGGALLSANPPCTVKRDSSVFS